MAGLAVKPKSLTAVLVGTVEKRPLLAHPRRLKSPNLEAKASVTGTETEAVEAAEAVGVVEAEEEDAPVSEKITVGCYPMSVPTCHTTLLVNAT